MRALFILSLLLALTACGGEDAPPPAALRGRVLFAGHQTGPLTVAVVQSFPPMGPPSAFVRIAEPTFPMAYEIDNVPAGTWTVFAVLDVGNDNPTVPGKDDPVAVAAGQVTVSETTGATVADITLVDP